MSSFYSDASLVLVPSGYKTSKVYSAKPTDGTGDLTFTRSNDTATRVASNGLIERVRTNLTAYSEEFSNAYWTKTTTTITDNTAANPINGATTADTLTRTGGVSGFLRRQIAQTGVVTFSVFAKSGSTNLVRLNVYDGSTDRGATYNLTTGAITTVYGSPLFTLAQDFGSGWYRISIAVNAASYSDCQVHLDSVNSVIIFGTQLETGDIATLYIPTTTAAVSVGMLANVPRLDYLGGGCPKLLLEPQRTNVNIFSEDIGNATWDKLNVVTTNYLNVVVSPDGFSNADKMIPDTTSNAYHGIQLSSGRPTLTSGVVYTFSVFAKAQGYDKIRVQNFSNGVRAQFNLTTGALINQSGTTSTFITPYGNGWYRIGFTYTQSSTIAAYWNTLVISTDDNSGSAPIAWAGNGTDSIAVWGHTIEEGAYATSYIPTLGAAVTRGADACSKTGISSLIGQTQGTIYLEADIQKYNESGFYVAISAGSVLATSIYLFQPSSGNLQVLIRNTGNPDGSITINSANWTAGFNKVAIAYTATTAEVFINGVSKGSTSFVSLPALSQLTLGARPDVPGSLVGAGPYSQALLFKTRLSNSQLAELTSL